MIEYRFTKENKVKAVAHLSSYIDGIDDDKEYIMTVKQARGKRSLNANAYAWVLMNQLAEKLEIKVTELYRQYIKDVGGNMEHVTINTDALSTLRRLWEGKGIGWQVESCPTQYEGYTDAFLYYGSSTFDSRSMSRLIELIVQDCKENGIETLEDIELRRLIEEWKPDEI
jgi:hypothetical protein